MTVLAILILTVSHLATASETYQSGDYPDSPADLGESADKSAEKSIDRAPEVEPEPSPTPKEPRLDRAKN